MFRLFSRGQGPNSWVPHPEKQQNGSGKSKRKEVRARTRDTHLCQSGLHTFANREQSKVKPAHQILWSKVTSLDSYCPDIHTCARSTWTTKVVWYKNTDSRPEHVSGAGTAILIFDAASLKPIARIPAPRPAKWLAYII